MTYTLPWKIQSPPQLVKSSSEEIRCKFIVVFIGSWPIDMCKMGCERSLHTQWSSPPSWLKSLHTFNFPRVWEAFTHAGSHHPGYLCPMSRTQLCLFVLQGSFGHLWEHRHLCFADPKTDYQPQIRCWEISAPKSSSFRNIRKSKLPFLSLRCFAGYLESK